MGNLSYCPICKRRRRTAYWNMGEDMGSSWFFCCACNSTYTIEALARKIGKKAYKYIKNIEDNKLSPAVSKPDEIQRMAWPAPFISIMSPRAKAGREYLTSRGLNLEGQIYYDNDYNGIALPLYYKGFFVGAQVRLISPWIDSEGKPQKITTLPSTKKSLLFYNYDQGPLPRPYRAFFVTEGPIDALSAEQSFNAFYGSTVACPIKCCATLGSGISNHQLETLKGLKKLGYQIILAPDRDAAGLRMAEKSKEYDAITHIFLTDNVGEDINDVLKKLGHIETAKYIIKRIKSIT